MSLADTASPPEIIWTTIGLLSLVINLALTYQAWGDYTALIRLGQNGGRKIAARTAVGIQSGLTVPQLVAVLIGVVSMLTPPPNPARPVTATLVIVTGGLLLIELSLVVVGALTHIGRLRLLGYLERHEETVGQARHDETMTELVHNTELTTEARDGAVEAFHAANSMNERTQVMQQDIAQTNRVAGESAASLETYMRRLEEERQEREGR